MKNFLKTPVGVVCALVGVLVGAQVPRAVQFIEAAARCVGGAA